MLNNNSSPMLKLAGRLSLDDSRLFFVPDTEELMSMVPVQINRLQRDIRELDIAIRRAIKHGNLQKAQILETKKEIMMEHLDQFVTIH